MTHGEFEASGKLRATSPSVGKKTTPSEHDKRHLFRHLDSDWFRWVSVTLPIVLALAGAAWFIIDSDNDLQSGISENQTKLEVLEERIASVQSDVAEFRRESRSDARRLDNKIDRLLERMLDLPSKTSN